MNQANLAKLFHNYIESYNVLTDAEHDELRSRMPVDGKVHLVLHCLKEQACRLGVLIVIKRSIPATESKSATNFAPIETRGLSFLSCRAQPKYGMTATTLLADALLAASTISRSSIKLSELGKVD